MASLGNARLRGKINDATAECRACSRESCPEYCWEMLQQQLDEILDEARSSAELTCRFSLEYDREILAEKKACGPGEFVTQDGVPLVWTCSCCGKQYANSFRELPSWLKHCPECGAKVVV